MGRAWRGVWVWIKVSSPLLLHGPQHAILGSLWHAPKNCDHTNKKFECQNPLALGFAAGLFQSFSDTSRILTPFSVTRIIFLVIFPLHHVELTQGKAGSLSLREGRVALSLRPFPFGPFSFTIRAAWWATFLIWCFTRRSSFRIWAVVRNFEPFHASKRRQVFKTLSIHLVDFRLIQDPSVGYQVFHSSMYYVWFFIPT